MSFVYDEETVDLSGTITCPTSYSITGGMGGPTILSKAGSGRIETHGFEFIFTGTSSISGSNGAVEVSGFGMLDTDSITDLPDGGGASSLNGAGTWEISIDMELCFDVLSPSGLEKPLDSPLYADVIYFKRPKEGGNFEATLTLFDRTVTISGTIGTPAPAILQSTFARITGSGKSDTWEITGLHDSSGTYSHTFMGITSSWQTSGAVRVVTGTDGGQGMMEATTQKDKPVSINGVVRSIEHAYPDDLTVNLVGVPGTTTTTASGGAFTASGTQRYFEFGSHIIGHDSSSEIDNADEDTYGPVSATISKASLSAAGDGDTTLGTDDFRVLIHGKTFDAITLTHAASTTVDAGTSLTPAGAWAGAWTGEGGTSPSVAGDGIAFTVADAAHQVQRAFTDDVSFSSYPFLRIPVKADDDNAPISFSIYTQAAPEVESDEDVTYDPYTKSWGFVLGAADAFADCDIDLSGEQSASDSTSAHDTKWPIHRVAPADEAAEVSLLLPVAEGTYFGVQRVTALIVHGLAAGVTYTIGNLTLRRSTGSTVKVDYLPVFYRGRLQESVSEAGTSTFLDEAWPVRLYPVHGAFTEEGGKSEYFARRFLLGYVDSQQILEERDSDYVFSTAYPSGITTVSHGIQSIQELADDINRINEQGSILNPGWTATVAAPADDASENAEDGYYNRDLPATFIHGGGALYNGSWEYGLDKTIGSVVKAQPLFDSVDYFEGCSEWTTGPDGTIPMSAYLRGGAHGKVMESDKDPLAGVDVDVTDGGAAAGSGTSGADGAYQTTTPYGKGYKDHTITADAGTQPSIAGVRFYPRKRHRGVFIVTDTGEWVSMDISATGRIARAEVIDGEIVLGFLNDPTTGTSWSSQNTGIEGDNPHIRYDRWSSAQGRLWILYEVPSAGGVAVRYTDDEGRNVSVATTVNASGTQPAHVLSPTGVHHFFWRTSGAAIEGKILDGQGNVLKAVADITLPTSGVADDDLAAVYNPDNGYLYLEYRDTSGNLQTIKSTDGGITYS